MTGHRSRSSWHDALDTQMSVWSWNRTPMGQRYEAMLFDGIARGAPEKEQRLVAAMLTLGRKNLAIADPVFVSSEMCDVVEAAMETFQPEPLIATDLFIKHGFMLYERPIVVPGKHRPSVIAGASWTPCYAFSPEGVEGLRNSDAEKRLVEAVEELERLPLRADLFEEMDANYQAREGTAESAIRQMVDDGNVWHGVCLSLYERTDGAGWETFVGERYAQVMRIPVPGVLHVHSTPWWLGHTFDGNEVDSTGEPTAAAGWWKLIQTTFRLMQQRIAAHHPERPDRPARREAKRAGIQGDRDIVVVRLRRERSEHHGETGEANYSHRFIVSGHWRNQWYPSGQVHRQIWISPYVKGPEDAPLRMPPRKVYQWTR